MLEIAGLREKLCYSKFSYKALYPGAKMLIANHSFTCLARSSLLGHELTEEILVCPEDAYPWYWPGYYVEGLVNS